MLGLAIVVVGSALGVASDYTGVTDAVLAMIVVLSPAAIGAGVRFSSTSRLREQDQVRLREREQLARELHDTVAHHVSAIAVRAQAGRVVAASDPSGGARRARGDRAGGVARPDGDAADGRRAARRRRRELAPQRGVADIERLATGGPTPVAVELSGDLDGLRPAVGAALYRLAQESVTNALRHARYASRVSVAVTADEQSVRLTVVDDGELHGRVGTGYGLVGMSERATLLGGTLEAGPGPERGWTVVAVLPRTGAVA